MFAVMLDKCLQRQIQWQNMSLHFFMNNATDYEKYM